MVDDELFEAYFKKGVGYYNSVLVDVKAGKKVIFGIFPFLLSIFWMLYRKMYLTAFVSLIIVTLFSEFLEYIVFNYFSNISTPGFTAIHNIAIATIFGFFGNWLYIKDAERKIIKIQNKYSDRETLIIEVRKKGGTDLFSPLLLLAILILFFYSVSRSL